MRIHHLNCGTFCPVGKRMMNGHGGLAERGRLVCHCLLVESNDGLILVDTGIGFRDIADPEGALPGALWQALNQAQLDPEETAVRHVRRLGFKPTDVRHIILTHLDFDHAGGLADFPHAQVHVYRVELQAALARMTPRERMRYAPDQFGHRPDWRIHDRNESDLGERWYGFESVRAIADVGTDLLLIPLAGHSRGHCGVAVLTPQGWLLHAGDAAFFHGELEGPRRVCPPGLRAYQNVFQFDRDQRLRNQRRLQALGNDPRANVKILCSHDPCMFHHLAGQGKYEVQPELWQEELQNDPNARRREMAPM